MTGPAKRTAARRALRIVVGVLLGLALLGVGALQGWKYWQKASYQPMFTIEHAGGARVEVKAQIPEEKSAYLGRWDGPGTTVHITRSGIFSFYQHAEGKPRSIAAKIRAFAGNDIVLATYREQFVNVQVPPHFDGTSWTMTVEGVPLLRHSEEP
jgi:hypothetical protein